MSEKNTVLLTSFVEGADQSCFPLYNLPYGVFRNKDESNPRVGSAIGDYVIDLAVLENAGVLGLPTQIPLFDQDSLNLFASQGPKTWSHVRHRLQSLFSSDNDELQKNPALLARVLIPFNDIIMMLPFKVEGFSDFYASEQHATNVGKLFRDKDNPLLPNWKFLPVGYHGRASTIFLSGTNIRRPMGQIKKPEQDHPHFSPSQKLDFELELGFFIGVGNPDGNPISVDKAKSHLFGISLLNDWSARDIQAFEYQPLGPFLSKSFATSISPWVIPMEALEDFMQPLPKQIPEVVSYLKQKEAKQPDIKLKVEIKPHGSTVRTTLCETSSTHLYWSMDQILAHHTVNHCIMKPGDLLGSGTISGPSRENWGSLLEITFNGTQPIKLKDGSERKFLENGDTIIFTGYCATEKYKIGFGSLEGTITPS